MKILVLGTAGAMAQVIIRDLLESPGVDKIGVADISLEKAKSVTAHLNDARLVPILTNAQDNVSLASVMREYDVVINSTWYVFNLIVMEAAIRQGFTPF